MRVLIADDQMLFRESIGYILKEEGDFEILEMASNGEEAVEICQRWNPDLVLMDIEMPLMNGVEATRKIKKWNPKIKIVMLTTFENQENILESFVVGADGYVVKNISHKDLVLALRCVGSGLTVIDESVKQMMIDRFREVSANRSCYEDVLDEKEQGIIRLIAFGKSNKEIAYEMGYSEGTVKNKISRIFEKLQVSDRMQLAIFAIENGMI